MRKIRASNAFFVASCCIALVADVGAWHPEAPNVAAVRLVDSDEANVSVRVDAMTPPTGGAIPDMFATPDASTVAIDYLPDCGTLCSLATPNLFPAQSNTTIKVLDYFTVQPVFHAIYSIDGIPSSLTATGIQDIVFPAGLSGGVHAMVIVAPSYAVYHNGVNSGDTASILLFPISGAIQEWLTQVNLDRQANGVWNGLIALDDGLTIAAFYHAADMAKYTYFAHVDPFQNLGPTDRVQRLGENIGVGENIAKAGTWQAAEAAFMNEKQWLANQDKSDCPATLSGAGFAAAANAGKTPAEFVGHFCNIVNSSYTWIGLGISTNLYVQDFADAPGTTDPLQTYPAWTVIPDQTAPLIHLPDFYEAAGLPWEAFQ
jgi:Cysteine-rich secretory protein family